MPKRIFLLFLSLLFLSGCATRCDEQFLYKPSLGEKRFDLNGGAELRFEAADGLLIHIAECGYAYRNLFEPVSLCMKIIPETGVAVRFANSYIRFFLADGQKIAKTKLEKLEYSVWCSSKNGRDECSSIVESPKDNELYQRKIVSTEKAYWLRVGVSPTRDFQGAGDSQHGYIVPRFAKLRWYELKIKFPEVQNKEVLVEFPEFFVNGQPKRFERVLFRPIRESVCRQSV